MKKYYPFILIIFFTVFAKSQEPESLEMLISKEKNSAKKAELLYRLSEYWSSHDTVKAWQNLKKARTFSDKKGLLPAMDFFCKAMIIYDQNPRLSEQLFTSATEEFSKINSKISYEYQSRSQNNIGILEQMKGKDDRYLEILINKCLPLAEKSGNQLLVAQDYQNIGLINFNIKLYDKAVSYYEKAAKILESQPASPKRNDKLSDVLNALTEIYIYKNDAAKASEYSEMVRHSLQKSQSDDLYTAYFLNSAKIFELKNNYTSALREIEKGLSKTTKLPSAYEKLRLLNEKSFILKNLKRYGEAAAIIKNIADDSEYDGLAKNKAIYHDELSNIYALKGDYKTAYDELRATKKISDSLAAENLGKNVAELETKFRTAEKEKEILQKEVEISKKNTLLWLFVSISALLLAAAVFAYFYFRNKKKLTEQREIILTQKLQQQQKNQELLSAKALLEGEERERERLAKDLHDGLGGMLAGVKLNLSAWAKENPEMQHPENFGKILSRLDGSVTELRRISRNMMPESLVDFGLETALKDLCEFYENEKISVSYQSVNLKNNLPKPLQLNIFRIVQELLANAVKHAEAKSVLVQCAQSEDRFFITVEDDGKGISADDFQKNKSLGLRSLRNRVEYLNGKIDFQTAENEGTSVNIELAIHEA